MGKKKIFVISGPSGAGKTTLLNTLFLKRKIKKNFILAVSYTTRKKRPREKEAVDYYFITKEEFLRLKRDNFFLESQKVLSDYYGTPKFFIDKAARQGKDPILCIDVAGGMYLKKKAGRGRIVTIFIEAPDSKEMMRRLQEREEAKESIEKRVRLAKKEMRFSQKYDYVIMNRDIEQAVKLLGAVLLAERS
ncbi:MAG: guanylate kinase [Candidatus Omnitrophota bacterium]